jgi:hypothetical protein
MRCIWGLGSGFVEREKKGGWWRRFRWWIMKGCVLRVERGDL